ncbi:MAG: pyridoxine 5'-phosphate synthase [Pseudohongiellaceae bacterium]
MSSTALSLNLNKIALLRNSREGNYPNPVEYGRLCIEAGGDGITVHPRPDQRHIRPDDVHELAGLCREYEHIEFNVEGNPFAEEIGEYPGFLKLVEATRPDQVTLVPDNDDQLTSDHGFNLKVDGDRIRPIIQQLHVQGIRVSLFMDPDPEQIALAQDIGANRIELYTGPYAWAYERNDKNLETLFQRYANAAKAAREIGLGVNAGHDLNLDNLPRFLQIPDILEVSIGHAFTADSLLMGMENCVQAYLDIVQSGN